MKRERLYLDYNATSPLAKSVLQILASGDFPFANPASQHSSGKLARKSINEVVSYFKNIYSLGEEYDVVFHSGATEAINLLAHQVGPDDIFIGFNSDHPAAKEQKDKFKTSYWLDPKRNGDFPLEEVQKILAKHSAQKVFLNFLWVHNETGVVWELDLLDSLTHDNLIIHVDAVQSVGKISNFLKLNPKAHFYTFSGHKFGALKSVGMSFIKKDFGLIPHIVGGGQQAGRRSGTENPLAIISLKAAHEEMIQKFSKTELEKFRDSIIALLKEKLDDDLILPAEKASSIALTTVDFIHKKKKADIMLAKFDMSGLDVSSGSACSSGQIQESPTLVSLGLAEFARNSIRISFGPDALENEEEILRRLSGILS